MHVLLGSNLKSFIYETGPITLGDRLALGHPYPIRALSILLVALLLLSGLPTQWSWIGTTPGEANEGPGPLASDSIDFTGQSSIPYYVLINAPDENFEFGYPVSNVGDVDGDGTEDVLIGANRSYESPSQPPIKSGNYLVLGRSDRAFTNSSLMLLQDMSNYWSHRDQRRLGDVNGDGFDDVASAPYQSPMSAGYFESAQVQVRNGGPDGLPVFPNSTIDTNPYPDQQTWGPINYGGLGDVNDDGLDDLLVIYNRFGIDGAEDEDAQLQLYYGSPDGIASPPDWTLDVSGSQKERCRYIMGVLGGDLNGDGHDDAIFQWYAGYGSALWVHHGSEEGLSDSPNVALPYSADGEYRVFSPLQLDGDDIDDLLMLGGGRRDLQIVLGRRGGAPSVENITWRGSTANIRPADINGDGLADLVRMSSASRSASPGGGSAKVTNVTIEVFFNEGGSFSADPGWIYTTGDLPGEASVWYFDSLDIDGDGLDDLVAGLAEPSYLRDKTNGVLIFFGKAITESASPARLEGGPRTFAMYRAYDIVARLGIMGSAASERVTLALDPGGADVVLECRPGNQVGSQFALLRDPLGCVAFKADVSEVVSNSTTGEREAHFKVMFGWNWPHEELCNLRLEVTKAGGLPTTYLVPRVFWVENDLAFFGDPTARGELQGPIAQGAWVKVGELVTVRSPPIVYEGTTDVYARLETGFVSVTDDDGESAAAPIVVGGPTEVSIDADRTTDVDETLTLNITHLPEGAQAVGSAIFRLRVDGELPVFRNPVPEPDEWHASAKALISITAYDLDMSGVDSGTLEYAYSTDGGVSFGEWTREGLAGTWSGSEVDGLVELSLPDGDRNYVRWRVKDLVGNGFAVSVDYRIMVDTNNVTFSDPRPPLDTWLRETAVTAGVTIHDEGGSGIDVVSVQYRLSPRNLSQYTAWTDWDEGSQAPSVIIDATVALVLNESAYNYIQWRAKDIVGHGYTTSPHYRLRVDITALVFIDLQPDPELFQTTRRVECWATADDGALGSGVAMASVECRKRTGDGEYTAWASLGMSGALSRARFSFVLELPDGTGNWYQLRAWDVAGNGPTMSGEHRVRVDTTPPSVQVLSPSPGARQSEPGVTVTVAIEDVTSGIGAGATWYRFGLHGNDSLGEWLPFQLGAGSGPREGTFPLALSPGPNNTLQVRAVDVAGNEVVSPSLGIWLNRPPIIVLSSPLNNTSFEHGEEVPLVANASYDPDDDILAFKWYADQGVELLAANATSAVLLAPGDHRLIVQVKDPFGASATLAVNVTVKEPPKLRTPSGWDGTDLMVLLLVLVALAASAILVARSRRRARE